MLKTSFVKKVDYTGQKGEWPLSPPLNPPLIMAEQELKWTKYQTKSRGSRRVFWVYFASSNCVLWSVNHKLGL